jgi:hypothetical protein
MVHRNAPLSQTGRERLALREELAPAHSKSAWTHQADRGAAGNVMMDIATDFWRVRHSSARRRLRIPKPAPGCLVWARPGPG